MSLPARRVPRWRHGDPGQPIWCSNQCGAIVAILLEPGGCYQVLCKKCRLATEFGTTTMPSAVRVVRISRRVAPPVAERTRMR